MHASFRSSASTARVLTTSRSTNAVQRGITVTNAPGTNSNAVADHAFALMLAICRGVVEGAERVKNGMWKPVTGRDVYKKTLGLVVASARLRRTLPAVRTASR